MLLLGLIFKSTLLLVISINALITAKVPGIFSLDGKVLVAADIAALLSLVHVCVKAIVALLNVKVLDDVLLIEY